MGFRQSPFPMIDGTTGHKKELASPAKVSYRSTSKFPGDYHPKWNPSGSKLAKKTLSRAAGRLAGPIGAGLMVGDIIKGGIKNIKEGKQTLYKEAKGHGGKTWAERKKESKFTISKKSPAKGYKKEAKAWAANQDTSAKKLGGMKQTNTAVKRFGAAGAATHVVTPPSSTPIPPSEAPA